MGLMTSPNFPMQHQSMPPCNYNSPNMVNKPYITNSQNPSAPPTYKCGKCLKEINDNDEALFCESSCKFFYHRLVLLSIWLFSTWLVCFISNPQRFDLFSLIQDLSWLNWRRFSTFIKRCKYGMEMPEMRRSSGTVTGNEAKVLKSNPFYKQAYCRSRHLFRAFVEQFHVFNFIVPTKLKCVFIVYFA